MATNLYIGTSYQIVLIVNIKLYRMSLELSEETLDELSPQLRQVITSMQTVNKLLHQYESSNESVFMRQAASKIKEYAPTIRALVQVATEEEKEYAKTAMSDMKKLVQKAKEVSYLVGYR
jgi:DNA-directed RNA polymerase sigma subunit (sigma70/sigma32)